MSDVTRFSIYGEFATCKDHIARDTAEKANTTADNASKLASEAKINSNNAINLATSANGRSATAETTANEAKTVADNAETIANEAKTVALDTALITNNLKTDYESFKKRNRYIVTKTITEDNVTIAERSSHSIPVQIYNNPDILGNQKILLCVRLSVRGGNIMSSGIAHNFIFSAQIIGSTSKIMRDTYYCPPSNYLDASTCFAITDITTINQITFSMYSYEGITSSTILVTVNIIPISGEEYVSE